LPFYGGEQWTKVELDEDLPKWSGEERKSCDRCPSGDKIIICPMIGGQAIPKWSGEYGNHAPVQGAAGSHVAHMSGATIESSGGHHLYEGDITQFVVKDKPFLWGSRHEKGRNLLLGFPL
jgi:hypothetical protein